MINWGNKITLTQQMNFKFIYILECGSKVHYSEVVILNMYAHTILQNFLQFNIVVLKVQFFCEMTSKWKKDK